MHLNVTGTYPVYHVKNSAPWGRQIDCFLRDETRGLAPEKFHRD